MNKIAIQKARLLDPESDMDEIGDVIIENGKIAAIGKNLLPPKNPQETQIIKAEGDLLIPAPMDMQVHVGEPGEEYRETLPSLSNAAIAGGVGDMLLMPDTNPAIDEAALVDFQRQRGAKEDAQIHLSGALTKNLNGKRLAEMALMQKAGAVAFCDAARPIQNALLMRHAMTYANDMNALVMHQPQNADLAANGVMHEGRQSSRLGLAGIVWAAETATLARDIALAEITGVKYHALQISTRHAIPIIRNAKKRGLRVSCGVSIHHLLFNEESIGPYKTFMKLMPPLREEEDRKALLDALSDGLIDVLVSGHNPQNQEAKRLPFAQAAFGSVGVETLIPAALSLHAEGAPLNRLIESMTAAPRKLLNLPPKTLAIGMPADLTLCRLNDPWTLEAKTLRSKSQNASLDEYPLKSSVRLTIIGGKIRFEAKKPDK